MAENDSNRIAIAIVVGAILVAGTIFLVTRPPDECAKWNDELLVLARETQSLLDANTAAPGSVAEDANDLAARARRTLAENPDPDECEISDEVEDAFEDFSGG